MRESSQAIPLLGEEDNTSDAQQEKKGWCSSIGSCLRRFAKRLCGKQDNDSNEQQALDQARPLLAEENGRSDQQQEEKSCFSFVWPITERGGKLLCSLDMSWTFIALGLISRLGEKEAKAFPAISTILFTVALTQYVALVGLIFHLPQDLRKYDDDGRTDARLRDQISRSTRNVAIAGVPYLLFSSLMFGVRPLLKFFKQDQDVVEVSGDFFDIYTWFMFASFIPRNITNFLCQSFKREGAAMAIVVAMLAGSITWQARIVFSGNKPSGVQGIALVSGATLSVTTLAFLTYIAMSDKCSRYYIQHYKKKAQQLEAADQPPALEFDEFSFFKSIFSFKKEDWKQIGQYIESALPIVGVTLADIVASLILTLIGGSIKDEEERNSALRALNFMAQYINLSKTVNVAIVLTTVAIVADLLGKRGKPTFNPDEVNAAIRAGHFVAFIAQLPILAGILLDPNGVDRLIGSRINDAAKIRLLAASTYAYLFVDNRRYFEIEVARPIPDKKWPPFVSSFLYLATSVGGASILTHYGLLEEHRFSGSLAAGAVLGMLPVAGRATKLLNEMKRNPVKQAEAKEQKEPGGLEGIALDDGRLPNVPKPASVKFSVWCCFNPPKKRVSLPTDYKALADDNDGGMDNKSASKQVAANPNRGSVSDCLATVFFCCKNSKRGLQDNSTQPILPPPTLSPATSEQGYQNAK